jgi:hypothetical protein
MTKQTVRRISTLFALALVSVTLARTQSQTSTVEILVSNSKSSWQAAQSAGSSERKLIVVTLDQPNRRQTCRVQSFTLEKLVCSRAIGNPRTYLPQQVAALIIPGGAGLRLKFVLGINAVAGAAIWGTVVLAAACPVCALATGIAALLSLGAAGAVLMTDYDLDSLLYLAPGQQLSPKLGYVGS